GLSRALRRCRSGGAASSCGRSVSRCVGALFSSAGDHGALHSFPTRRSSDLSHDALLGQPEGSVVTSSGGTAYLALRPLLPDWVVDRKSTRLNSSHVKISYAVFCLKKKRTVSPMTC